MDKKQIKSWVLYDWGSSAYATTMMAAVLPIFYKDVAARNLDETTATAYWGYSQSIAVLIVALLSPILGAIADYSSSKRKFLQFFAYMGMMASILFAFIGEGGYFLASILVIISTIGFSGGNVFYDGFLPEIAPKDKIDQISARGFAFGYIGGGILLLVNLAMIMFPTLFLLPNTEMATRVAFVSVGLWWFIFSIPMFKNVKDIRSGTKTLDNPNYISAGFGRLGKTFREIKNFKHLFLFLIAFWLFNDGISTIIKMATIYGSSIGIGTNHLIGALLITQFVGFPCTILFGRLAKKLTAKRTLMITLWVYVCIVILGYFMQSALHFFLLAFMVGIVQGGAQSLSRSIYGSMIPKGKSAEFFGFYGVSSKFAAIFGPFIFGIAGQITGSSRNGIISLIIFFIAGIILLSRVNVDQGRKDAETAAPTSVQM